MRHRKIDCDLSDLTGPDAEAVAQRQVPLCPGEVERAALEQILAGSNVTSEMLDDLESAIDRIAFVRAGEAMRHVLRSMGNTPAGKALERAILGDDGQSLATDAKAVRCTKQNLAYHEDKARSRIGHLTAGALVERTIIYGKFQPPQGAGN